MGFKNWFIFLRQAGRHNIFSLVTILKQRMGYQMLKVLYAALGSMYKMHFSFIYINTLGCTKSLI